MKTAKIFKHGNSQAVRLTTKLVYDQIMEMIGGFKGKIARRQPKDQQRKWR